MAFLNKSAILGHTLNQRHNRVSGTFLRPDGTKRPSRKICCRRVKAARSEGSGLSWREQPAKSFPPEECGETTWLVDLAITSLSQGIDQARAGLSAVRA